MSKPQIIIQKRLYQRPWFIVLVLTALVGLGFGIWQLVQLAGNVQSHTGYAPVSTEEDDELLEPTTLYIEYSDKTVSPLKLVTCNEPGATVSTEDVLDLQTVGVQPITYLVTIAGQEQTRTIDFTVRDTRGPTIGFVDDEPAIEQGDEFDAQSNIQFVTDEVDGDLPYRAAAPTSSASNIGLEVFYDTGWYTVEGRVYSDTPGTYTLKVTAIDKHGNVKSRDMKVRVNTTASTSGSSKSMPTSHLYVLNTRSHVFHLPSCYNGQQIADKNRLELTETRDEVLNMGYRPCENCNP